MTENSHQQPTTTPTYGVRSATDEDLASDFGASRLLIGFPVKPTPPGQRAGTSPDEIGPQRTLASYGVQRKVGP